MHGRDNRPLFHPAAGNRGVVHSGAFQYPLQSLGSYISLQAPNVYQQSSNPMNFPLTSPNFPNYPHQIPNFPIQQNSNVPIQNPRFTSQNRDELLKKIDRAVAKAHRDTIAAGVSVSVWKVLQSALSNLQVDSWSSLGFQMQDVASLRRIINTEGKINAFIPCFVAVRRITSLHDLEVAICKNEGVDHFEDLELGPLLQHPLVLHNFPVGYGATDVFKITSDEIIVFLVEFMDTLENKEVKIDEFLNFIAKKKSVTNKETLGVRIQSLGMYIQFFREAKRQEGAAVKKFLKILQPKSHPSLSQKEQLDELFLSISQRVESFTSLQKDFCGKHTRFDSSSSDDDDDEVTGDCSGDKRKNDSKIGNHFNISRTYVKNSSDHVSSCPYPSAIEEMIRLGLKDKMCDHSLPASTSSRCDESNGSSKKKRKHENPSSTISISSKLLKKENPSSTVASSPKLHKKETVKQDILTTDDGNSLKEVCNLNDIDISISDATLKMFISTWKEACKELTVAEALEKMLEYYKQTDYKVPPQERRRMRLILSSLPFIGLLNIAVTSIKLGMWDSIYDSFQAIGRDELANTISKYEIIDVEPSEKRAPCCVTVEEIIQRLASYFERDHEIWNSKTFNQVSFRFLRKLSCCEIWLAEQFCVKEFKSLGHGDFLNFLEKHALLLPSNLQKVLDGETSGRFPLEVYMLEHMLMCLVSQGSDNLLDNKVVSKQMLSTLLMRQFPSVSFKIVENGSMENVVKIVKKSKNNIHSNSVLFSVPLLGSGDLLAHDDSMEFTAAKQENGEGTKTYKSISSKDAVEVLLRGPLLSDLNMWSHWDLLFAPSLGPLVGWLLNEVNAKQLSCLVTKDGKAIRIDPLATVDKFLTAALQGSAYQTAVQLVSLYALSGGKKHVPLSLLKCQARQAFEIILNNCKEKSDVCDGGISFLRKGPLCRQIMIDEFGIDNLNSAQRHYNKRNEAVSVASRFILDCLVRIPPEFHSFAADVLLSGMRSVVKDAPSMILFQCNLPEQRVMLHEVGLTLGIGEWIDDYFAFRSAVNPNMLLYSGSPSFKDASSHLSSCSNNEQKELDTFSNSEGKLITSDKILEHTEVSCMIDGAKAFEDGFHSPCMQIISETHEHRDADMIIESIRQDEFGLDSNLSEAESSMLKKQHARLGRALHCLSHELYSQDSHFLLELVQNADDNIYEKSVEPTLIFILQESGVVILNNEEGFSAENIRALCDVGKSTKKGSGGYIGQKGIGFKSVFRVSDAPEIHSNGFHVKFDIKEGQIGFVLPTVVPPCNIDIYSKMLSGHATQLEQHRWNTCIILPFKSKFSGGVSMNNINTMFSDLHPSLLLFLHRLQCIVFQNLIENSFVIMKKEVVGDGIIKVSCGKDRMTWLIESQKLHVEKIRPDVKTTEVAIAFTLQESDDGKYEPYLSQQPVFSYLPLRTYGLKFILQGDFVLPSSREEVDVDSPWNQWLVLKFPDLFISAEKSFCALPCFMENPGKGVGAYMSFVPLVGEVHGFFSSLPRIIISKLRISNCLLLEGDNKQWVPPCKVLRGWNERACSLLTDGLLNEHLGLGLLNKDIVLTDSLSRALGIEDYGPKILVEIIASLSRTDNGLKSIGLGWLSSCLNELHNLLFHFSSQAQLNLGTEEDLVDHLCSVPFIPLSDGTYSSVTEGTIWLHSDGNELNGGHGLEAFPKLHAKLRTVNPAFLFASDVDGTCRDVNFVGNLIRILSRIGVQNLSPHEIMKVHILPAISDERNRNVDKSSMIEYLCFILVHFHSGCPDCRSQEKHIFLELKDKAFILTNHGFKKPIETPIHFGEIFGNRINVNKLMDDADMKWHEVSVEYLKHPASKAHAYGVKKWREFFQEIGVTDFVQVVQVDKSVANLSSTALKDVKGHMNLISPGLVVRDWESLELVQLLSSLSQRGNKESCKYLLEVLDMLWDDFFSDKTTVYCNSLFTCGDRLINSSFICNICDIGWVVSSMDDKLHRPKDLFYDCDEVRSILGMAAPYAVPKVRNEKLLNVIGFKTKVTLDDVLEIQDVWRMAPTPFKASVAQMTRFYRFIWNDISTSKQRIILKFHSAPSIFLPCESGTKHEDVVPGVFFSVGEVCWHDVTGSIDQLKEFHRQCSPDSEPLCYKTLSNVYPGFHDFFVKECSVLEMPSFRGYLQIVLELSRNILPSCAASSVFRVFLRWADELKSGQCSEDVLYLKDCLTKLEFTVLPTEQDKWVSLHHSFGLVCWCDDEKLKKIFRHKDNIDFLNFGKHSDEEQQMLQAKVSILMHALEIPALSEVVTREAIYEGQIDSWSKVSVVNWALPYAQRYLYTLHPDNYLQLKKSGFDNLNQLQIVVVEKLYYRNVIKRCDAAARKKVECNCLLQDNILYTTPDSGSHSLFMEFSRLLFGGIPDLHLANFLHMVTTMVETGSNKQQMESFILNSQRLQTLPNEESVWSLPSSSLLAESNALTIINEENSLESLMGGTNSNWPPVDSKTVPGFSFQPVVPQLNSSKEKVKRKDLKGLDAQSIVVPIKIDTNLAVKDDSTTSSGTLSVSGDVRNKFSHIRSQSNPGVNIAISSFNLDIVSNGLLDFGNRDQLNTGAPNSVQALETGRTGEEVAFRYITHHFADRAVRWVNEYNETGLPYDIVIGDNEDDKQYIEVKATKYAKKDWFYMSVREWQFATVKGDSFIIAHVLLGNQQAELKFHANPVKRCQEGNLRLVIMMPRQ